MHGTKNTIQGWARNTNIWDAVLQSIKTSLFQPDRDLKKLTPAIQAFDNVQLSNSLRDYKSLSCRNAKQILAAKIIHDIISLCSEDILTFDDKAMFVDIYHDVLITELWSKCHSYRLQACDISVVAET